MKYWITNPTLTPEHDWKVDGSALGEWTRSGWQVRDNQDDPAPEVPDETDPAGGPIDSTTETPAGDEPETTIPTKKGEV